MQSIMYYLNKKRGVLEGDPRGSRKPLVKFDLGQKAPC